MSNLHPIPRRDPHGYGYMIALLVNPFAWAYATYIAVRRGLRLFQSRSEPTGLHDEHGFLDATAELARQLHRIDPHARNHWIIREHTDPATGAITLAATPQPKETQ